MSHGYPPPSGYGTPPPPPPPPPAQAAAWHVTPSTAPPAFVPPPVARRGRPLDDDVSGMRAWLGGFVDQLTIATAFLVPFGVGNALSEADISVGVTVTVLGAILGVLLAVGIGGWWLSRRGTTTGLWVLGVRVDPRAGPTTYEEGLTWFAGFWAGTAMAPLVWTLGWLFDKIFGPGKGDERGWVRDPRTRGAGGVLLRLLVLAAVAAAPVGAVVWLVRAIVG